jgi:uncharacterized protein HemX
MATRQDKRRGSVGPIIFVIAFLAVLAVGLSGWYAMTSGSTSQPARVITTGFPGPDATERNQQLLLAQENKVIKHLQQENPEATHGH